MAPPISVTLPLTGAPMSGSHAAPCYADELSQPQKAEIPVIFLLSVGADPTESIEVLARRKKVKISFGVSFLLSSFRYFLMVFRYSVLRIDL